MELNVSRQPVFLQEMICDTAVEQPVEGDMLLPDYCPDLVRVLRCTLEPGLEQVTVTGDRLTVDGTALVHIHYKGEQRQLCHAEYRLPFHKVVELGSAPQTPMVQVWPAACSCTCRVVSQRRVDLRGSITLRCQVMSQWQETLVSAAEGQGVQCREETVPLCQLLARETRFFQHKEEAALDSQKPPVNTVLRTEVLLSPVDCKVMERKVLAKAEANILLLYRPEGEEDRRETVRLTLPLSEIFEVDGLRETDDCTISFGCCSCQVQPQNDLDGAARTLALDLQLAAQIAASQPRESAIVTDCYSTEYPCQGQYRTFTALQPLAPIRETVPIQQSLRLPDGVTGIADLWCTPGRCDWEWADGTLTLNGEVTVSLLGSDEEGELEYFDQILGYTRTLAMPDIGEKLTCTPIAQLTRSDYTMGGEELELRAELLVTGLPFGSAVRRAVTDLSVDTAAPLQREDRSSLTVYFADPGESVWEIAKRYHTSPQWIMEENGLSGEEPAERRMLLIPVV